MTDPTAPESGANIPTDLRQLVNLWSWRDADFKSRLLQDPQAAITDLATRLGLELPDHIEYRVVRDSPGVFTIPVVDNPVGTSPAEIARELRDRPESQLAISGGAICTITAECGCSSTVTGGCPCGTVWGTPCIACGGPFVTDVLKLDLGDASA